MYDITFYLFIYFISLNNFIFRNISLHNLNYVHNKYPKKINK